MFSEPPVHNLIQSLRRFECVEPCDALVLTVEALKRAERELGFAFPPDYVRFIRALDGLALPNWELYRFVPAAAADLERYDIVTRNRWLRAVRGVPADLIAFFSDGLGDECCFDTTGRHGGWPIFRWRHDAPEDDRLEPEARSFLEWIERAIRDMPDTHR